MAVTVDTAAGNTAIRPFAFEFPEEDLKDLRARVAAPQGAGVSRDHVQRLVPVQFSGKPRE